MSTPFKKILVLSVSAGAGHVRAADALVKAFHAEGSAPEIVHLDTLQYTSKAVRTLYSKAYFEIARGAPDLLGWIYDYLDKPWKNEKKMRALERINVSLFMKVLRRIQPDLVVNTHFLPADIISYLRKKEQLQCKQAVVITDFDAHAMWLSRDVDFYCTACEEEAVYLSKLGIRDENIRSTGIPIDVVFQEEKEKALMRQKYALRQDQPVILLSTGGLGLANMQHILDALTDIQRPVQVLAMCGRNDALQQQVEGWSQKNSSSSVDVRACGYTTDMDEYMSAADVIVGKPGGLTSSEALTKGLPMIIVDPIPGQEERNTDFLLENGVAWKCNNLPTLGYKIEKLLSLPDQLQNMRRAALATARPHAARDVVRALSAAFGA